MGVMKRKQLLEDELKDYPAALSRDEAAEIMGISRRKIDDLVERKVIPSFVVDPASQKKQVKINKSDLMAHMLKE